MSKQFLKVGINTFILRHCRFKVEVEIDILLEEMFFKIFSFLEMKYHKTVKVKNKSIDVHNIIL